MLEEEEEAELPQCFSTSKCWWIAIACLHSTAQPFLMMMIAHSLPLHKNTFFAFQLMQRKNTLHAFFLHSLSTSKCTKNKIKAKSKHAASNGRNSSSTAKSVALPCFALLRKELQVRKTTKHKAKVKERERNPLANLTQNKQALWRRKAAAALSSTSEPWAHFSALRADLALSESRFS